MKRYFVKDLINDKKLEIRYQPDFTSSQMAADLLTKSLPHTFNSTTLLHMDLLLSATPQHIKITNSSHPRAASLDWATGQEAVYPPDSGQ